MADADEPAKLQPLAEYDPPAMPTDDWLRTLWARLKAVAREPDGTPFLAADKLRRATRDDLQEKPPDCSPLVDEIDAGLSDWAAAASPAQLLRLIVLPPCDANGLVRLWAARRGHAVLDPPPREALLQNVAPDLPKLDGEGVLVIPDLGRWFLRHRRGLAHVRALLAALATLDRRCVVGCGSWAWSFLSKAVEANAILPSPLTFEAFDAERLQAWFQRDVLGSGGGAVSLRLSQSGQTISPQGRGTAGYFQRLAAQSRGIPWVAWWMWRDSLRSAADDDESQEAVDSTDGRRTLWVAALEEFALPARHEPDELLVLQAVLIHGGLDAEELGRVVPTMRSAGIVQSLLKAGVVERHEGRFRCRAAAYPAARRGLVAAGFPVAEL